MLVSSAGRARETPALTAYPVVIGNSLSLSVWCSYCRELHVHEHQVGYHEAGCKKPTPYAVAGYNLHISTNRLKAEEVYAVASACESDYRNRRHSGASQLDP